MRLVKSPREIALIREATRLSSLGILEAMKAAQPGMYEYELEAVVRLRLQEAQRPGHRLFRAWWPPGRTRTTRTITPRRRRSPTATSCSTTTRRTSSTTPSDVTRMFPANGRFSAVAARGLQRPICGCIAR